MGSAIGATTGFVTDSITKSDCGDVFPDEDFFPDISTLFLDDMANDGANTNTGGSSSAAAAVYVFFINLVLIVSQDLCLAVCLVTCFNMFSLFHMISIFLF